MAMITVTAMAVKATTKILAKTAGQQKRILGPLLKPPRVVICLALRLQSQRNLRIVAIVTISVTSISEHIIALRGVPRRMVLYADSGRDSGICRHPFAGLRLLVFPIKKAYKAIRDLCQRREQIGFPAFDRSLNLGLRPHHYLRA